MTVLALIVASGSGTLRVAASAAEADAQQLDHPAMHDHDRTHDHPGTRDHETTRPRVQGGAHDEGHAMGHVHVAVPDAYANAQIPVRAWTDPGTIARGKAIYATRCAVCHGERGDGKGPAAGGLPLKPADLSDAAMVAMMPGTYWFWRVSEGGQMEPFRSQGSAMPAWKQDLSVSERWAVIAYAHTLSGHTGPHTSREHPGMGGGHMQHGGGEMEHRHGH